MRTREHSTGGDEADPQPKLTHLRRDARTALELAVIALAPAALVARLAASAGLLEALAELPTDSPPVVALVPRVVTRAQRALEDWQKWHQAYLDKRIARG
jgi:hypothetical protein